MAPTTFRPVSFRPSAIASDTTEFTPPRDGMKTRKKIARSVFLSSEKSRSMSGGGGAGLAVFDGGSNSGPQQYPLSQTPLSIILDANVNLGRQGVVTGHSEQDNATVVTAQDPQRPQNGNIQMVFTAPTELRQWVVTDDSGQKTTVILGEMQKGGSIPSSRFSIQAELGRR